MHAVPNNGIRGRSSVKATTSSPSNPTQAPIPTPYAHAQWNSRPRPMPLPPNLSPTADMALEENALKKSRSYPSLTRIVPTSVVITTIMLTFFIFAILVSRNVQTVTVANTPTSDKPVAAGLPPSAAAPLAHAPVVQLPAPQRAEAQPRAETHVADATVPSARRKAHSAEAGQPVDVQATQASPQSQAAQPPQTDARPPVAVSAERDAGSGDTSGLVSWNRSWPRTERDDVTGLYAVAAALQFTNLTMLNYFHLHKTGGVTTKAQLREVVQRADNKAQPTKRGEAMGVIETCYRAVSPASQAKLTVREVNWRCDFRQIKEFPQEQLRSFDVIMGHQYWQNGCDFYFGAMRSVQYFSIFRHPLPRKLSFFYHFFVRNEGREEKSVSKEEVMKFVLADDLSIDPRSRDSGPNYFASRFMSNGMSGFIRNQYPIPADQQDEIIRDILERLDTRYAFVGLQAHNDASQCMLEKAVQVLAHAHGIDTMVGTTKLGEASKRLNSGEYPWTARKLWDSMTPEQKKRFNEVERVDLAIYKKAVERFTKDVKLFSCQTSKNQCRDLCDDRSSLIRTADNRIIEFMKECQHHHRQQTS